MKVPRAGKRSFFLLRSRPEYSLAKCMIRLQPEILLYSFLPFWFIQTLFFSQFFLHFLPALYVVDALLLWAREKKKKVIVPCSFPKRLMQIFVLRARGISIGWRVLSCIITVNQIVTCDLINCVYSLNL